MCPGFALFIAGKDMTFSMCALATSEGFPNFDFKITFALSYPSVVKGRPSMKTRALGANNSFKYENLEIGLKPDLSI